jgi:hypothetical protein
MKLVLTQTVHSHRGHEIMRVTTFSLAVLTGFLAACSSSTAPAPLNASAQFSGGISGGGGGGGGTTGTSVDVIKVVKHSWAAANYTLLVSASSSNSTAHLYVSIPSGAVLGEVQNGGGGQYGGTVFFSLTDPGSITITSSAGGSITVPTVPFQP